ncbi:CPBP family intramembrane glutamic endopeptidase [Flagellimonas meishanensis]|uniref:CPBP family intramembrane glutamic endopeptidase n=1 Tax=Flagellimonas meishanensis TaxID=2873264 RepID=UPI001CA6EC12|nr:type II CAAX endopeptidase family protein [[Muricauda] meishanensis]
METKLKYRWGRLLNQNRTAIIVEIALVFGLPMLFMVFVSPYAKGNLLAEHVVVWFTNAIMILLISIGLWLRGESWKDFGITLRLGNTKELLRVFLWSLLVFVITLIAFGLGYKVAILFLQTDLQMDMSGYEYLKNNTGVFILSLVGVYVISSFGEEFIYRGFLVNRLAWLFNGIRFKNVGAILLSSILFGLIHYKWGAIGMVQTFFMGLALASSYVLLKKRLNICILAHAYMDSLLFLNIYFG